MPGARPDPSKNYEQGIGETGSSARRDQNRETKRLIGVATGVKVVCWLMLLPNFDGLPR
jgi:hypothetical protein